MNDFKDILSNHWRWSLISKIRIIRNRQLIHLKWRDIAPKNLDCNLRYPILHHFEHDSVQSSFMLFRTWLDRQTDLSLQSRMLVYLSQHVWVAVNGGQLLCMLKLDQVVPKLTELLLWQDIIWQGKKEKTMEHQSTAHYLRLPVTPSTLNHPPPPNMGSLCEELLIGANCFDPL